jgi:putative ABC transport system ATP-binding protein
MPTSEFIIETTSLTKTYALGTARIEALRALQLKIGHGEHVAITGPSGSGKTTLLNILGCLDTPTDGIYRLDGQNIMGLSNEQSALIRNKKIGFVFQNFNLLPRLTALSNVELPLVFSGIPHDERRARAEDSLGRVGLPDRLHHRPSEMSGGQQQRVAIARAIVTNPSILLADEPTGNLDRETGKEILSLLQDLNRAAGLTLVTVTHEADIADKAGHRIEMVDGRIIRDERTD